MGPDPRTKQVWKLRIFSALHFAEEKPARSLASPKVALVIIPLIPPRDPYLNYTTSSPYHRGLMQYDKVARSIKASPVLSAPREDALSRITDAYARQITVGERRRTQRTCNSLLIIPSEWKDGKCANTIQTLFRFLYCICVTLLFASVVCV